MDAEKRTRRRRKQDVEETSEKQEEPSSNQISGDLGNLMGKLSKEAQTANTTVSNFMWAPDEEKGFEIVEVKERNGDLVKVLSQSGVESTKKMSLLHPLNPQKFDKIDDMAHLGFLNEPSVLHNLKLRYEEDKIYTYSGLFLVVVNPYKRLPIYTKEVAEKHKNKRRENVECEPHVFTISDMAYRAMILNKQNQSLLCTGESGAGKTENAKKIIQYLTQIAGASEGGGLLEQQLLRTNPLLESFGNAKTIKNNNSSRFGKFIEIDFNANGFIAGTKIQTYLLETTRVIHQNNDERNFHFFYQITQNSESKKKYRLSNSDNHHYMNQSGCTSIPGVDDSKEFLETMKCMDVIGIDEKDRDSVCACVASIIHLGDVKFSKETKEGCFVVDKNPLNTACEFLGINAKELEEGICHPKIIVNKEVISTNSDQDQSGYNRNALVKSIYLRMFNWIVKKINQSLASKENIKNFIGILDIAGFEIFENNSFEQLCINYTNEKLQQFFNHHMFKKEQEEYMKEKIEWTFIDFGLDLQPTIDLIEKPLGVFSILDNTTFLTSGSDEKFASETVKNHATNPVFKKNMFDPMKFSILHYAGEVLYNTNTWLSKNVDPLNEDCKKAMSKSSNSFIKGLFKEKKQEVQVSGGVGNKGARFNTVAATYKEQLKTLMTILNSTEPSFIRCILPNLLQKPGIIDPGLILHQLRCNGVLEGIRISRKGYPGRIIYDTFVKRHRILAKKDEMDAEPTIKGKSRIILKTCGFLETKHFKLGLTKVFLRSGVEAQLEESREAKIGQIVVIAQSAFQGYAARLEFKKLKEKIKMMKLIQRNWRSYVSLKNWSWWTLFQKVRPLVSTFKRDAAIKKQEEEFKKLKQTMEEELEIKKALESERDDLKKEISKQEVLIQAEQEKQKQLLNEMQQFKERMNLLDSEINTLKLDKSEVLTEKSRLEAIIQEKEEKLKQKQQDIEDAQEKQTLSLKDIENLKKLISNKDTDIVKLETKNKSFEEASKGWKQKYDEEINANHELDIIRKRLDEKVKELEYNLDLTSKSKGDSDDKVKKLIEDIKNKNKEASGLKVNIDQLSDDLNKLKQNLLKSEELLKGKSKDFEDLEREKKKLDNDQRELTDRLNEEQRLKTKLDTQVRHLAGDNKDLETEVSNLKDVNHQLDENLNSLKIENTNNKNKIIELSELNGNLNTKYQQLETDSKNQISKLTDDVENQKKSSDNIQKKMNATIQDLQNRISELEQIKSQLEAKIRNLELIIKNQKKEMETMKNESDELANANKQLNLNIVELNKTIDEQKKINSDLEKSIRDLQNKLKNAQSDFENAKEDNKKLTEKYEFLKKSLSGEKENIIAMESEKDELLKKLSDKEKEIREINLSKNKSIEAEQQMKNEKEGLLLSNKSLKEHADVLENEIGKLKQDLKSTKEEKDSLLNDSDEQRKNVQILDTKNRNILNEQKKLKQNYDELQKYSDSQKKKLEDTELENKNNLQEVVKSKQIIEDFTKKNNLLIQQLNQSKNELSETNSNLAKLKESKNELKQKLEELENQVADHKSGSEIDDATLSEFKNKLNEIEKKADFEKQQKLLAEQEIARIKLESDRLRDDLQNESKKYKDLFEKLKNQFESNESEYNRNLKKLTEEKNLLKKENRLLQKQIGKESTNVSGNIPSEAIEQFKKEYEIEITKLKSQLQEEQNIKIEIDLKRKTMENELYEIKEKLDKTDRQVKKVESQKKALQIELEEVKESAEESDDLREEITNLKKENEQVVKEIKNDLEKERLIRIQKEESLNKLQKQIVEIKSELEIEKNKEGNQVQNVKKQFENEINEMEAALIKAKRDKNNSVKNLKKFEREARELTRKLQTIQKQKEESDIKLQMFEKDIKKLKNEKEVSEKEIIKFQSQNEKLTNEVVEHKNLSTKLEEELFKTKEVLEKEKRNSRKNEKKFKNLIVKSGEEDIDEE